MYHKVGRSQSNGQPQRYCMMIYAGVIDNDSIYTITGSAL